MLIRKDFQQKYATTGVICTNFKVMIMITIKSSIVR